MKQKRQEILAGKEKKKEKETAKEERNKMTCLEKIERSNE